MASCVLWLGCAPAEQTPVPAEKPSAPVVTTPEESEPQAAAPEEPEPPAVATEEPEPAVPEPAAVGHRKWVSAIRGNEIPPECDEAFVEAVRRVNQRHGKITFDAQGNIQSVDLAGERVSVDDGDVAVVSALPGLRGLLLAGQGVTGQSLESVSRQTELTELLLQDAQIRDEDLRKLAALPKLASLTLRRCMNLSDEGLAALSGCPSLTRLQLLDNTFSDRAIDLLAGLKGLELLDLRGCDQIASAGLVRLAELPTLRAVRLGGYAVNDEVLEALARMPALRSITLDDADVTNSGLAALGSLQLEELNLARCLRITDAGFAVFDRFEKLKSTALRDLAITDAALVHLSGRPLESLSLRELLITGDGIAHLKSTATLRRLELRQVAVSDAGLEVVGGMTGLESLNLSENGFTDAALASLPKLVRLTWLDLSGNPEITDKAVKHLTRMRQLKSLRLLQTGISPKGLNSLRASLSSCEIVSDSFLQ